MTAKPITANDILDDLVAEQTALDDVLASADDAAWAMHTPSPGWTVADQIGHLTYFDHTATVAIVDPDAFQGLMADLLASLAEPGGDEAFTLGRYREMTPTELLDSWRTGRADLSEAGRGLDDKARVAWYGPSMGAKSFLTARLMECWAHGQDIVDTLGADRPATDRIRHIAQLGYITRSWSYINRGETAPDGDVNVSITAPSGDLWTWGDSDTNTVTGPAEDFCLVVTQRRNAADTDLVVTGDLTHDWLQRAQAFAGPPTDGPA